VEFRPAGKARTRKPDRGRGAAKRTKPIVAATGLPGVGLGGDSSPRVIAFQARVEFRPAGKARG